MGRDNFEGGKGRPIVKYRAPMGSRNHVLNGGPAVMRDVAMETNFGTKIAINWHCVNDSD